MQLYWKRNQRTLRDGVITMIILAPLLGVLLSLFESIATPTAAIQNLENASTEIFTGYPESGRDIDVRLLQVSLPPPPLDALPYDVQTPLDNGPDVDIKRRWLWVPDGEAIRVVATGETTRVIVPTGAMWWKEFYLTTDRGVFLVERRIILRTEEGDFNDHGGWSYFTAHYQPPDALSSELFIVPSTSETAQQFHFDPDDWLPTQNRENMLAARFEDVRGGDYRYIFPGTTQCAVCHAGATGAYPNPLESPIRVFGLHPNNLTASSLQALVERGWLVDGDMLLTQPYFETSLPETDLSSLPVEAITPRIVAHLRNNCASCHNPSPDAAASFTGFVIDPNYSYSTDELIQVLSRPGIMMGSETYPLVSPGSLETSEIWLRLHGENGRRRMPPIEGGAPESYQVLSDLIEAWILGLPQP